MIEVNINVPELRELIKEIAEVPGRIFCMLRLNVKETVGNYLTHLMKAELTFFLGRDRYEKKGGHSINYRNGNYERRFTIKGIGEVRVRVPRDREGHFSSAVLPRSNQYEDAIREDMVLMFLSGISTRSLSMLSRRLIGRPISHEEISKAGRELTEAVEQWRTRDLSGESIKYLYIVSNGYENSYFTSA